MATSLVAELAEKLSSATNNLDFDEQTLFLNTSADTVGIGTNSPASKLDVRGTMQVGVNDTGYDVKFFGDTSGNYWLWDTSADGTVQVGNSQLTGTLTVGVDDTGHDVKFFGATSGKYWLWDEDADGTVLVGSSTQTGNAQLTGTLTVGVDDTGHDVKFFGATAGNFFMWDESANTLQMVGTQAMFDKYGANANPLYFDLRKTRHATAMGNTALSDNDVIGHIRFMGDDGNSVEEFASIKCLVNGTVGNADTPGELQFWTTPDGSATPAQRMTILNSGNVGIGTSAPDDLLHVFKGDASAAPHSDSQVVIEHSGDNALQFLTSGTTGSSIYFGDAAHTNDGGIIYQQGSRYMSFRAADAERMRITSDGKVGIGTTTIAKWLTVRDDGSEAPLRLESASRYCEIGSLNTSHVHFVADTSSTHKFWFGGGIEISGALTKGSGSFKIPHPLPAKKETHNLIHSFVEAPQADNIYRGQTTLVKGKASVNIDEVAGMSEGTFEVLNREIQCFTSNESGWTPIKGTVSGNIFTITAEDDTCTDTIHWLVIGERKDPHMYNRKDTDSKGKIITEPLQSENDKQMKELGHSDDSP